MASITTNEYSYDGAKFKVQVIYSYNDSSISWHWKLVVSDGKFKSGHYVIVYWIDANGNQQSKKTDSTHKTTFESTAVRNLAKDTLKVWFKVGSKTTNKISATPNKRVPDAPTGVSGRLINDARAEITISGQGYPTRHTTGIIVERATDTQTSWSQVGETISLDATGQYSERLIDDTVEAGHKYWYRAKATNSNGDSAYRNANSPLYTSPNTDSTPDAESTGSSNRITWSVDSVSDIDKGIIQGWYIKRSTNGGAFVTIGTVYASTSQYNYEYIDYSISGGNTYKYAITAFGSGGSSHDSQEGGSEIESKPSRPLTVKAYRNTADNVVVNIEDNDNNTANTVLIERSIDGGTWEQVASESFPYPQYIDTTALATDTIKYRVRNQNSVGYSEYTESNIVLVKSKPNPPDLLRPINNAVLDIAQEYIELVFRHNSTDGSPQLEAKLDYRVNDGEWTEIDLTTESVYSLATSGLSPNDIVEWKVKTKGSHAEFSDFSSISTFTLLAKPEMVITEPNNADVIDTLPVETEWVYNDQSGTLKEMYIDVLKDNKVEKTYSVDVGTGESGTYNYSLAGFLFDNNSVYALRFRALSSSGLSATQTVSITIQYEPVSLEGGLLPTIVLDEENGYANISILRDVTDDVEPVEIAEAYLYRTYKKERVLLAEVQEGSGVLDKYAPLNHDYTYELLQLTVDGRISLVQVTVNLSSTFSFIYFGDEIIKMKWNPEFDRSFSRPDRTEKQYSGRKHKVVYDTDAREVSCRYSCAVVDESVYEMLEYFMGDGNAQGIWKSVDGDSYYAIFDLDVRTDRLYRKQAQVWNCTLTVKRIEASNE